MINCFLIGKLQKHPVALEPKISTSNLLFCQEKKVPFKLKLIGIKQDKLFHDVDKVIFKFVLSTNRLYSTKENKRTCEELDWCKEVIRINQEA
jgi:hypothetical protein